RYIMRAHCFVASSNPECCARIPFRSASGVHAPIQDHETLMHQPDSQPRPSIYYDYQVFPFVKPAEFDDPNLRHQVVVVGAGPIGLATALDLARYGVQVVLLSSEQQVSEG